VRRPEDVIDCQQHVTGMNRSIPVIAKLEKLEAIRNLAKILEVADAVMVARGDLGVELKLGELPAVQKDVIDQANRAGVPVITATEMLESMVTANRPTRGEASDVANAIWDGTDAVMLSQETSIGAHPEVLRRTALYSGVLPLLVSPGRDTDEMIANATEAAVQSGMVRPGDRVVVVAAVPVGRPGQTNLLKVETV